MDMINYFIALLALHNFVVPLIWSLQDPLMTLGYAKYVGNASNKCNIDSRGKMLSEQKSIQYLIPEYHSSQLADMDKMSYYESMADDVVKENEDPNLKQALMSRAFINSANYAFQKNNMDKLNANSLNSNCDKSDLETKLELNLDKKWQESFRFKRDLLNDNSALVVTAANDEAMEEDNLERNSESLEEDESQLRIHCVRAGPTELICKHDNFSYNFKLPPELFNKKIVENLVASVCSLVEEASPDDKGDIGISVNKIDNNNERKERINNLRHDGSISCTAEVREKQNGDDFSNRLIKINIPIDFNTIPIEFNNENKPHLGKSDKQLYMEEELKAQDKTNYNYFTPLKQSKDESQDPTRELLYNTKKINEGPPEKWFNKRNSLNKKPTFSSNIVLSKRSSELKPFGKIVSHNDNYRRCKQEKFMDILMKLSNKTCLKEAKSIQNEENIENKSF